MKYYTNTSFHVATPKATEALEWLKKEFVPAATAQFDDVRLMRLVDSVGEGITSYAVLMIADDPRSGEIWCDGVGADLLDGLTRMMGDNALFFTTRMEEC